MFRSSTWPAHVLHRLSEDGFPTGRRTITRSRDLGARRGVQRAHGPAAALCADVVLAVVLAGRRRADHRRRRARRRVAAERVERALLHYRGARDAGRLLLLRHQARRADDRAVHRADRRRVADVPQVGSVPLAKRRYP